MKMLLRAGCHEYMPTLDRSFYVLQIPALLACLLVAAATADDWPMWRYDACRSAVTAGPLAEPLILQWKRQFPKPRPAFQNKRLQFDRGYEPIVQGKRMFVASTVNDSVTALHTETGEIQWRFYTDGPVRCAPVAAGNRVYFGSDDGHLYCLKATDGVLQWKFRAVPSPRRLLGNQRMISVWPVRGGPVLKGNVVCFAAGVWPFEGVYVYALDADTGKTVWLNDRAGFIYGKHPHGADAMGGVSPQGYLLIQGDELIVPCGSAYPARFDLQTGKLKGFQLPVPGRFPGGWFAAGKRRQRGEEKEPARDLVFDKEINSERHEDKFHWGHGETGIRNRITVGDRALSFSDEFPGVHGPIHAMLTADSKLFVVTLDGWIYCFGPTPPHGQPPHLEYLPSKTDRPQDPRTETARQMLEAAGTDRGYALALGVDDGGLVEEIVRQSSLHVVVLEPDTAVADAFRRRLDEKGLYGIRATVLTETPPASLPPYFASLVFTESLHGDSWLKDHHGLVDVLATLRPYGGTACFPAGLSLDHALDGWHGDKNRPPATAWSIQKGSLTRVTRKGPLPGATDYTESWKPSPDAQVKAPLGVLWYGDEVGVFKRSPQPQIIGGVMRLADKHWSDFPDKKPPYKLSRLIYQDVYTGRILTAGEAAKVESKFPPLNLGSPQRTQYRPPTQKHPMRPEPPRAGERINPLTGKPEPRVFPKSYGCDGGFDYGLMYTMRSGTAAFYDKRIESGSVNISGPRSGCSNSIIPANGVLNLPYFYVGCTCSYPLPTGAALTSMPERFEQWSNWGRSGPEAVRDIVRVGVNFGAPGDRMGGNGTLWLNFPDTGGPSPAIEIKTLPDEVDYFYSHSLSNPDTRLPWVTSSAAEGLTTFTLSGLKAGQYNVRVFFPRTAQPRLFDLAIQGQTVLSRFAPPHKPAAGNEDASQSFRNISSRGTLTITLVPRAGRTVISGIEILPVASPFSRL